MSEEKRTATSTGKLQKPEGGDPLEQPIARSNAEDKEFLHALLARLQNMKPKLRLAKIMMMHSQDIQIFGFLRKEWLSTEFQTLRAIRFGAQSLDQYPMPPGFGKFNLIGGLVGLPIQNIRAFMWVTPEDENNYFKQFTQFQKPD